jgi:hypothetical protein
MSFLNCAVAGFWPRKCATVSGAVSQVEQLAKVCGGSAESVINVFIQAAGTCYEV